MQQAANGTNEVSGSVAAVTKASGEAGDPAGLLLQAASSLTTQSDQLRSEV
jgi:methyl-accepting chemotaxis protein